MIFTHEYTIYLLQVSKQFISFRAFGPSGNKLPGHLQQINVYIHLQKSRYCVFMGKPGDAGCLQPISFFIYMVFLKKSPK